MRWTKFPDFREPIPDDRPTTKLGQTVEITRALRKKDRDRCIKWLQRVDAFSGYYPKFLPIENTSGKNAFVAQEKPYIAPKDKSYLKYLELWDNKRKQIEEAQKVPALTSRKQTEWKEVA